MHEPTDTRERHRHGEVKKHSYHQQCWEPQAAQRGLAESWQLRRDPPHGPSGCKTPHIRGVNTAGPGGSHRTDTDVRGKRPGTLRKVVPTVAEKVLVATSNDNDHSSSQLSVHKALTCPEGHSAWAVVPPWLATGAWTDSSHGCSGPWDLQHDGSSHEDWRLSEKRTRWGTRAPVGRVVKVPPLNAQYA